MKDWEIKDNSLVRVFEFKDFNSAIGFVNGVSVLSEIENHHPNIYIYDYKFVEITLRTHDAGNKITEKDIKLGNKIDSLYSDIKSNEA